MKISKEEFLTLVNELYHSDEYNKAICKLAYTKDKSIYAKNLLNVLKIEQEAIKKTENRNGGNNGECSTIGV